MARFSKSLLIESCQHMADSIRALHGFTDRSGTAQLATPRLAPAAKEREEELISRAVEYGRAQAFHSIATWADEGSLPLPKKD